MDDNIDKILNKIAKGDKVDKKLRDKESRKFIENVKAEQNQEMLWVLEQEQRHEAERERQLKLIGDTQEKKALNKMFGMERAKAHTRIESLAEFRNFYYCCVI